MDEQELAKHLDSGAGIESWNEHEKVALVLENEDGEHVQIDDVREIHFIATSHRSGSELRIRLHTFEGDVAVWKDVIVSDVTFYLKVNKRKKSTLETPRSMVPAMVLN